MEAELLINLKGELRCKDFFVLRVVVGYQYVG